MSSTLPRRMAHAALLVAAGAAPVVGAASAHAAGLPLGGLPLDVPGAARSDVTRLPIGRANTLAEVVRPGAGLPLTGVVANTSRPDTRRPFSGIARFTDAAGLGTMASEPGALPLVRGVLGDTGRPTSARGVAHAPQNREAQAMRTAERTTPGVDPVDLVRPYVGSLRSPETVLPTGARNAVGRAGDAVGHHLDTSVVRPAGTAVGPSLPVAGYATDRSLNAAMPATDTSLAYGTQRHIVTNVAFTVDGISTPLREVPYAL